MHADIAGLDNDIAACLRSLGRLDDAELLHRSALERRRAAVGHSLGVAESLNNLAGVHADLAQFDAAIAELREAHALRSEILGAGHLLTVQTLSNLAITLWRAGERDQALAELEGAETGYRELGGDGERELGLALASHGSMLIEMRELAAAAEKLAAARELLVRRMGPDHPSVANTLTILATLEQARGRADDALPLWEEALRIRRLGPGTPRELAAVLYGLGTCLAEQRRPADAAVVLAEALEVHRAHELGDAAGEGRCEFRLGSCLSRTERRAEARAHLLEAVRLLESATDVSDSERAYVQEQLRTFDARK